MDEKATGGRKGCEEGTETKGRKTERCIPNLYDGRTPLVAETKSVICV